MDFVSRTVLAAASLAACAALAEPPKVHIIYMGGNDCPPCRAWRAQELPKLEKTEAFKRVKFSYVEKLIRSGVPPSIFLSSDVKPYKDQLDEASNGIVGSPQTAILVDGKVYDYYFGVRKAKDMERMLNAIHDGKAYPFARCLKRETQTRCKVAAKT